MTEISNPHDRFFKDVLSRREAARDFVLYYLPADVAALLDIESLVVSKDSFVDKELREHFSDIIYQVDLKQGDSAYIYLLFEHKSYSDPLIALHLLCYMIKIWEQGVKQGKARPFSPIIPIVVYHGKSKWNAGPDFYALFDLPDGLQAYMPNFRYLLCDLSHCSDEEIKGTVTLRAAFLLLKHIFSDDLSNRLPEILSLLKSLSDKQSGLEYLETILKYLASGTDRVGAEDLKNVVTKIFEDKGEHIMPTLAEQWTQQGLQQGLQQGKLQSVRESVVENLEARFDVVPRSVVKRIDEIEELSLLKILHKKSVVVDSLGQFKEVMARLME